MPDRWPPATAVDSCRRVRGPRTEAWLIPASGECCYFPRHYGVAGDRGGKANDDPRPGPRILLRLMGGGFAGGGGASGPGN